MRNSHLHQIALSGSKILGYWKDENTGDIYAFAEFNLSAMEQLIERSDSLSTAFKDYYRNNNNANFERFVDEIKQTQP